MEQVEERLKQLLTTAFDIRPGEYKRTVLLQANIFILITTILILKSVTSALFLAKFGAEQLPIAYVLIAITAGFLTYFYSRDLNKKPLIQLIKKTHWIAIFFLIFFGVLLWLNFLESSLLYAFFIGVSLFAVLSASQFWVLVNLILNVREAKRLVGFIGSGAIAGGIFGGYLTSLLAGLVGTEKLLFLAAAGLSCCLPIYTKLWSSVNGEHQQEIIKKRQTKIASDHPLKLLLRSKHLTLVAGIVGISVVVAKLIDFQFSELATRTYTDTDDLAVFFGFWFSTMNLASIVIQLFITKRVVGTYGVGFSLFILPFAILIPSVLLLIFPQLWAAILLKVNEGSLKQSVNKAGVELLILPVPTEIKKQTKTFIDVFVDSLATGVGGILLIVLVTLLDAPVGVISLLSVLLVGIWFYLAWKVRKEYIQSFKSKVGDKEKEPYVDFSKESVISGLQKVLKQGRDSEILFVLDKLKEYTNDAFFEPLKNLLHHHNAEIRTEAIRRLYYYRNNIITDYIQLLIHDADAEVRVAAFEYLIEHSPGQIKELSEDFLSSSDYRIYCGALLSLSLETKDNPYLIHFLKLRERTTEGIANLPLLTNLPQQSLETVTYLKCIAYLEMSDYFDWIVASLDHQNKEIVAAAVEAAGISTDMRFVNILIAKLHSKSTEKVAQASLANYGIELVPYLRSAYVNNGEINEYRKITTILENLDSQEAVDVLLQIVNVGNPNTRTAALKSLSKSQEKYPYLNFHKDALIDLIYLEATNYHHTLLSLYAQSEKLPNSNDEIAEARKSLIDLLERRLDGNLERIFYLLDLQYATEDMQAIYQEIQSERADLQSNAMEFLDNLLNPKLKRLVLPILEFAVIEGITKQTVEQMDLNPISQLESFELLLNGKDVKIKLAVLYLMSLLKDERYADLASGMVDDENPKVRSFAQRVSDT